MENPIDFTQCSEHDHQRATRLSPLPINNKNTSMINYFLSSKRQKTNLQICSVCLDTKDITGPAAFCLNFLTLFIRTHALKYSVQFAHTYFLS